MKKLNQIALLMAVMVLAMAGCDAGKEVVNNASSAAGGAMEGLKDLAGVDFGGMDAAGLKEKLTGIADGFKDVTAENVDGLATQVSDLDGVVGGLDAESMSAPAKTALGGLLGPFSETISSAMEGISDDGIMGKLKPAVEPLMEKIKAFM